MVFGDGLLCQVVAVQSVGYFIWLTEVTTANTPTPCLREIVPRAPS